MKSVETHVLVSKSTQFPNHLDSDANIDQYISHFDHSPNDTNNDDNYEQYKFYFDYPSLKEYGSVQVFNNRIHLIIPDKGYSHDQYQKLNGIHQNIQLIINNQLILTSQWLPIYTINDFYKCRHLFQKCYQSYAKLIDTNYWSLSEPKTKNYDELTTVSKCSDYSLSCIENNRLTLIDLNIIQPKHELRYDHNYVEIFMGSHSIFNSKQLFSSMTSDVAQFLISFLLFKLIKY